MVNRLWVKLVGTISLLMILGLLSIYISVQILTKQQYKRMVFQGDIVAAEQLSGVYSTYFAETGGWDGIEEFFLNTFPMMPRPQEGGIEPFRGGLSPGMLPPRPQPPENMLPEDRHALSHIPSRLPGVVARIVITDRQNKVVFDSAGELKGSFHPAEHITEGALIMDGDAVVGHLFVGTMIEPALNPADRDFLSDVNRAVLLVSTVVVLVTLGIGSLLVLHITSPVQGMSKASLKVAAGDFSVRVPVERKDEIGNLARHFNRMAESLEKAERSRKQMISDSAHELRTPVSLIQGKLEMILEGVYTPDRQQISEIFQETTILTRLIEELQELADADAGLLAIKKEETILSEIINQAIAMYGPEAENKGVRIESEIDAQDIVVSVDRQKLHQVLTNLLANSLRYTDENGLIKIDARVVSFEKNAGKVRLSVYNSGPSIPDDKLERIFDRFYRLDTARNRKSGGKGLGLAISKAIVEAHGGRIWAENVPGDKGVLFVMEFSAECSLGN